MSAILFIHGLNSECSTAFPNMMESFRKDHDFDGWDLPTYDYISDVEIAANGSKFYDYLRDKHPAGDVYIVAHSMGGLVARYACLSRNGIAPAKRLIMIATPNFGVLRSGQLSFLAQALFDGAKRFGLFNRKPGVLDLTRVNDVFRKAYSAGLKRTDVEYVTIPATYYNNARQDAWTLSELTRWESIFSNVNFVAQYSTAMEPILRISLAKPHDGIVEEASTRFVPLDSGRWSEKADSVQHVTPAENKSYCHVLHRAADELNHINVTHDPEIIGLVKSLILTRSIPTWIEQAYGRAYELQVFVE